MDPLTASTTVATIIGLICNYRQEKGGREALSQQRFLDWLEVHKHNEIRDLISRTHHLQSEVDALLRQDLQHLTAKLNGIEQILSNLLSKVEDFSGLVRAIHPSASLSEGAFDILKLMVEEKARFVQIMEHRDGIMLLLLRQNGEAPFYSVDEPLFLQDDLNSLADSGLVLIDHSNRGEPQYVLTRAGANYVRQVLQSRSQATP